MLTLPSVRMQSTLYPLESASQKFAQGKRKSDLEYHLDVS